MYGYILDTATKNTNMICVTEGDSRVMLDESVLEKDLGVHVDNKLDFAEHVNVAVTKGNRILGMIRRSFVFLDKVSLKMLFQALVRPLLEYANVVWSPRFKKDMDKLERVQRRATRFIPELRDLQYEDRLKELNMPSLTYRRCRGDAIETYKYLHGIHNVNCEQLLPLADRQSATRGHQLKLAKRRHRLSVRGHFFNFRVVNMWNNLPDSVVMAPTLNCFKNRIDRLWKNIRFSSDPAIFARRMRLDEADQLIDNPTDHPTGL